MFELSAINRDYNVLIKEFSREKTLFIYIYIKTLKPGMKKKMLTNTSLFYKKKFIIIIFFFKKFVLELTRSLIKEITVIFYNQFSEDSFKCLKYLRRLENCFSLH